MKHPLAPAYAAGAAALLAVAGYLPGDAHATHVAWTALHFAILAGLAWTDAVTETVPDILTLALVVTGVVHAFSVGAGMWPVAGGAALVLLLGVVHGKVTGDRGWIGSGDFFLVAGVVAWFGPVVTLDVLALASLILPLHGLLARRTTVAVAPALAAASAIIWIGGPIL